MHYHHPEPEIIRAVSHPRKALTQSSHRQLWRILLRTNRFPVELVVRKCKVYPSMINRRSAQHDWVARANDYDAHVSELRLARLANARENLIDKQLNLTAQMLNLVNAATRGLHRKRKFNTFEVARLFAVASDKLLPFVRRGPSTGSRCVTCARQVYVTIDPGLNGAAIGRVAISDMFIHKPSSSVKTPKSKTSALR